MWLKHLLLLVFILIANNSRLLLLDCCALFQCDLRFWADIVICVNLLKALTLSRGYRSKLGSFMLRYIVEWDLLSSILHLLSRLIVLIK